MKKNEPGHMRHDSHRHAPSGGAVHTAAREKRETGNEHHGRHYGHRSEDFKRRFWVSLVVTARMVRFKGTRNAIFSVLIALSAVPAGHTNLEEGLPVHLEDADPPAYRERELQGIFDYIEQKSERYRFDLTPVVEFGFPKNTQLKMAVPLIFGKTDKTGSADIHTSILYKLTVERGYVPAVALKAAIEIPTGIDSRGIDPSFKLILTKTIGDGKNLNRIHLNGTYGLNAGPRRNERRHLYTVSAGYSQGIGPNSTVIFDFYRERDREKNEESNVFELGSRIQFDPLMIFSIGGGVGAGDASPRFHVTMGLERSLSGRYFIF